MNIYQLLLIILFKQSVKFNAEIGADFEEY